MKYKKVVLAVLIVSLIGNIYFSNELYKANRIDRVAAGNNFMAYVNTFEYFTKSMESVLENVDDEESYYQMLAHAESLRINSSVQMNNYYGHKNKNAMNLSLNIMQLATQITSTMEGYFYVANYKSLPPEKQTLLKEVSTNFNTLSKELRDVFPLGGDVRRDAYKQVSQTIKNTVDRNNEVFR